MLKLPAQEEFIEPVSRVLTSITFTQLTGGVVILKAQLDDFPDTLGGPARVRRLVIAVVDEATTKFAGRYERLLARARREGVDLAGLGEDELLAYYRRS